MLRLQPSYLASPDPTHQNRLSLSPIRQATLNLLLLEAVFTRQDMFRDLAIPRFLSRIDLTHPNSEEHIARLLKELFITNPLFPAAHYKNILNSLFTEEKPFRVTLVETIKPALLLWGENIVKAKQEGHISQIDFLTLKEEFYLLCNKLGIQLNTQPPLDLLPHQLPPDYSHNPFSETNVPSHITIIDNTPDLNAEPIPNYPPPTYISLYPLSETPPPYQVSVREIRTTSNWLTRLRQLFTRGRVSPT